MQKIGFLSLILSLVVLASLSCTKANDTLSSSSSTDINAELTSEEKSALSKIKDVKIN